MDHTLLTCALYGKDQTNKKQHHLTHQACLCKPFLHTHTEGFNIFMRTAIGVQFCPASRLLEHPPSTRQHALHGGQDEGRRPPAACGGRCAGCHGRSLQECAASSAAQSPDWPMSNPELATRWKTEVCGEKRKPNTNEKNPTFRFELLIKC